MNLRQGILVHIDLKSSCVQGKKQGSIATDAFYKYLATEIRARSERYGFQFVKSIGDASLCFGNDPDQLAAFCVDLFTTNPIPDSHGFKVILRPAAFSGFFALT